MVSIFFASVGFQIPAMGLFDLRLFETYRLVDWSFRSFCTLVGPLGYYLHYPKYFDEGLLFEITFNFYQNDPSPLASFQLVSSCGLTFLLIVLWWDGQWSVVVNWVS
jgi:hypothetical protein